MVRRYAVLCAVVLWATAALAQGWAPHPPIYIYGDDAFTWENGVIGGSGTADDPYIIEGWAIDTLGYDYGIYIDHTTAYFVVRNCVVRYPQERAGIFLSAVNNGRIEGCSVYGGKVGIHLLSSSNVTVTGNAVGYCDKGIVVSSGSEGNLIYGNSIIACGLPAVDEGLRTRWYYEGKGNYWSDYRGQDYDGDGIGDSRYEVVPDQFPLMEPPVELPPEAAPLRTVNLSEVGERGIVSLAAGSLVQLVANDVGVGVDKIFYRLDGGEWQVYSEPFPLPDKSVVRMEYYSVDKLGNKEPQRALTLYLDIQPPVTRIVAGDPHYYADDGKLWATSHTPFALVSEDESGAANIFYRIDGGEWRAYTGEFTIPGPEGPHKVEYYAIDLYGNREAVQSAVIWKDDSAPTTEATAAGSEGGESPFEGAAPEEQPEQGPESQAPAPSEAVTQTPPEQPQAAQVTFHVTLAKAELVENHGVGSDWELSYKLNGNGGEVQTASLPFVLYSGPAAELALTLMATERDEAQDDVGTGIISFTLPWTIGTYDLEVPVYEDNVQTGAKYALWHFTVEVGEGE